MQDQTIVETTQHSTPKKRRHFQLILGLLAFSLALPIFLPAGEAEDPYLNLDLRFPEGFEELDFVSSSQGGPPVDGLITRDRRSDTEALLDPNLSTDANGIVTGTVDVVIVDDSGTTVTSATIPVSGRTRLITNTFIRETGGPSFERIRMKQHIGLRGRAQGDDGHTYVIILNALSRFGVGNSSDELRGNLLVFVSDVHRGRSRVEIAPFDLSYAEIVVSKDTVNTATLGRIYGDAVVLSDSLGTIPGGISRMFLRYNDDNHPRPGSYLIHARNGRFRVIERGWLYTTEEEAEESGQNPEVILDDADVLLIHASSASALNLTRIIRRFSPK